METITVILFYIIIVIFLLYPLFLKKMWKIDKVDEKSFKKLKKIVLGKIKRRCFSKHRLLRLQALLSPACLTCLLAGNVSTPNVTQASLVVALPTARK